jgi:hypothetical protein
VVSDGITLIADLVKIDQMIQTLKERTHKYTYHGDLLNLHSFLKRGESGENTDYVLVYSAEVGVGENK